MDLHSRIHELLVSNSEEGYSKHLKTHYSFIKPSRGKYPFQWFWDTAFHVFILCHVGETSMAQRNLRSLFAMQADDGFIGHMIYWNRTLPKTIWNIVDARPQLRLPRPHMSSLVQPPFVAQALAMLHEVEPDEEFTREMLVKIIKYLDWLHKHRALDGTGLLTCIDADETGMDWKPSFDRSLGYKGGRAGIGLYTRKLRAATGNFLRRYRGPRRSRVQVQEVGFNTAYALDLYAAAELCEKLNLKDKARLLKRAQKVDQSITARLYSPEHKAFLDRDAQGLNPRFTPTIFFPLMLTSVTKKMAKDVLATHLANGEFDVKFPLPSLAINDPAFDPEEKGIFIWRGSTWIFHNWFLLRCLRKHGEDALAQRVLDGTLELIERSGFREYYNPFTGEGSGAYDFTWSGLVLDMLD